MADLFAQHVRIRLAHDILASVNVVQGDTARELYFIVDDYDVPDDAEYRIYIRKPSGKEIYNYCYFANGEIVVQLTAQMCAEIGTNIGQIQIVTQNHVIVTSFNFQMIVEKNMIIGSDIDSSNEFGILDELINQARISIEDLNNLNQTVQEQESARVDAENSRANAESQRVEEFNNIKNEFNDLKTESEQATSNANQATSNANQAASSANQAADRANDIADELENAINGIIDDNQQSELTTYSSNKISHGFIAIDNSVYTLISNSTNIDSLVACGNYYASSSTSEITGLPTNETVPFKLIVDVLDDNNKCQIVNCISNGHIYMRKITQDSVGQWEKIMTSNDIGDLSSLSTTNKTNVVSAINDIQNQIGTLSQLPTTDKSNIVSSISEILSMIQISTTEPSSQPINGWWVKEL